MEESSFLQWEAELSLDDVFKPRNSLGYTFLEKDLNEYVYWLEGKADGRTVLVRKGSEGVEELTPDDFNVRTRVHEYGGKAYTVVNNVVYFSNFKDQRIYKQDLNTKEIKPLTPEKNNDGSTGMYAGYIVSPDNRWLIFVYEKSIPDQINNNYIGFIDLRKEEIQEAQILIQGDDYYAEPRLSSDGKLSWLTWQTRFMPWESTYLYIVDLAFDPLKTTSNPTLVHGDTTTSIVSPRFDGNNKLYFVADYEDQENDNPKNWWNIYRYDPDSGSINPITKSTTREYGSPLWIVNQQRLSISKENNMLYVVYTEMEKQYLEKINLDTLKTKTIDLPQIDIIGSILLESTDSMICLAGFKTKAAELVRINLESENYDTYYAIKEDVSKFEISEAEHIEFPTKNGDVAYAYFFPPRNSKYKPLKGEKPPCRLVVHGGPTGRTFGIYALERQYWTNSGFAILDINHRGSTGYGRKFRDKLKDSWGIVDAEDVYYAVQYFKDKGYISENVSVAGGSAGGYAVQRALTLYPKLFTAGASYYGIGNLFTLFEGAKKVHKFEAFYGVYLFGGMPDEKEQVYKERSPIFHLDKLETPLIIFQGAEDNVVTPKNSREMAKILKEKGIKTKYIEYEGEGHGFRVMDNRKDALTNEIQFYREAFNRN